MNLLLPFQFDNIPARGRLLRLEGLASHVPSLKQAGDETTQTLAELLTLAALLTSDSKHTLSTTLQIQHAPTGSLMFAHASAAGELKAYANTAARQNRFQTYADGQGLFAVTLEPTTPDAPRYQSMVELTQASAAACLQAYFSTSVQTPTYLMVATGKTGEDTTCGALMLQALPGLSPQSDDWARLGHLTATLATNEGRAELLGAVSAETLLHRLFHEDTVRVFPAEVPAFSTSDPRPRMLAALASLPNDELHAMLKEGPLTLTDETTGISHQFSAADLAHILTSTLTKN